MKLIIAIIRPEQLEAVREAVEEAEACLLSISQAGDGQTLSGSYRGIEFRVAQPRLRLEIAVVNEKLLRTTIEGIARAGSRDALARINGSLFVLPLDEYVPIVKIDHEQVGLAATNPVPIASHRPSLSATLRYAFSSLLNKFPAKKVQEKERIDHYA
jgi:nitrogen regulatory protein PII